MKKLWKSARIGHLDFEIRWTIPDQKTAGQVNLFRQYMRLEKMQKPQVLADTFFHEFWHVAEKITPLLSVTDEEARMQMFAGLMTSFFRDNSELVKDLVELAGGKHPLKNTRKHGRIACRRGMSRSTGRYNKKVGVNSDGRKSAGEEEQRNGRPSEGD